VIGNLNVYWWQHVGAMVVVAAGRLDATSYNSLRDTLAKVAAEAPRAVLVDLNEMRVCDRNALALFPAVGAEIAIWPGIPLLLVTANEANHRMLLDYRMRRYLPVHRSIEAATDGIATPPPRRVARVDLPNGVISSGLAHEFVTEWCERWQVTAELTVSAARVATALVGNTMKHTYGPPTIRIELRRGVMSVAVYDGDPEQPHLIGPGTGTENGLTMIDHLCRAWGSARTPSGGKVVWATL